MTRSFCLPLACLFAIVAVGCGGPKGPLFVPVEGRVTFAGQPVTGGEIFFVPDVSKGADGPMSVGELRGDGSYALRGPGGRVGAVIGSHRVYLAMPGRAAPTPTIVAAGTVIQQDDAAPASPRGLPDRLFSPDSSGLTADVIEGDRNTINFEISR